MDADGPGTLKESDYELTLDIVALDGPLPSVMQDERVHDDLTAQTLGTCRTAWPVEHEQERVTVRVMFSGTSCAFFFTQ